MNRITLLKSMFALVLLVLLPSITTAATETITWIHTDHLGSPIAGRNDAGETTWEQAYAPWGEKQAVAGVPQAPAGVGYTGHVYDEQVGLIYAGARWYDPAMGRFISPDAVRFSATRISHFNRYAYANDNPVSYVDPDGDASQLRAPYAVGHFVGRVAVAPLINRAVNVVGATTVTHTLGTFIYDVVHNEADTGSSSGEVTSDREPGTDGKRGSTSGPGEGKRFKPETPEERAAKEGVPCAYCGIATTNEPGHPNSRERDHIDPKSRGGNNSKENERDSCRTCNRGKGARNPDEWNP